jgi:hypothetical protein
MAAEPSIMQSMALEVGKDGLNREAESLDDIFETIQTSDT